MDSKKLLKTLTAGRGAILVPHIENYLERGQFPEKWDIEIRNNKKDDGFYHPSSDAFAKPSDLYLKQKGLLLSRPINSALRKTFDCGHMWHGYIQNILVEMKFVLPEDVERYVVHEVETKHGKAICAGTGDLVGVRIPGHGTWLVDIKTMNKPEFEQGASDYTLLKWNAQVSCYMDWFGFDKAFVLAICKDSPHEMREYQIVKNDVLLAEIYDRWTYVSACVAQGVEPDPDYNYNVDPILTNPGDSVLDVVVAEKAPSATP